MGCFSNGAFVSPIPFNVTFEQSEFVPKGKAVAYDKSRYHFYAGSEVIVREFDQTLALEAITTLFKTFAPFVLLTLPSLS